GFADGACARASDAVDRREGDGGMLLVRDVDACNSGHVLVLDVFSPGLSPGAACGAGRCRSRAPRACAARSCTCGRFSLRKPALASSSPYLARKVIRALVK